MMLVSAPNGRGVATPCGVHHRRHVQQKLLSQRSHIISQLHLHLRLHRASSSSSSSSSWSSFHASSSMPPTSVRCVKHGAVNRDDGAEQSRRVRRAMIPWRVARGGSRGPVIRAAAFSGDDDSSGGDSPRDKWAALCRRAEAQLPAERQVLRRIVRWVGENPVSALITAVAAACTAGAIASALALQLAFSGLSIVLPAVLFATVGASTFLFLGSMLLFGFIIPSAGFMFFATGGTVLATLSAVAPIVCFAIAAVVGAKIMDNLLPTPAGAEEAAATEEAEWQQKMKKTSGGGGGGGDASVDRDLDDFDKRLYGDAATWSPAEVRRWLEAEGLGQWGRTFEAQEVDGGALLSMSTRDLQEELGVTSFPARKSIGAAIERLRRLQE